MHDAMRGLIGLARLSTKDNELDLLRMWDAVRFRRIRIWCVCKPICRRTFRQADCASSSDARSCRRVSMHNRGMPTWYNRIAGESLERLAALSDGIFAVAMTILVLDIHAPAKRRFTGRMICGWRSVLWHRGWLFIC